MKRKKLPHNHLAEGEATGHYHAAEGATLYIEGEQMFAEAPKGMTVTHQEHHTQVIPAGEYQIGRVMEYDHFAEEARQVAD